MIMIAGAMNNFILCFILLFLGALIYGSVSQKPVVSSVSEEYPAYQVGIREGDTITKINGEKVASWSEVQLLIQTAEDSELTVEFKTKDNVKKTVKITPVLTKNEDGSESYKLGVGMGGKVEKGFMASLKYAVNTLGSLFKLMFTTLKQLFTGHVAVKELSGPVGIYTVVGEQAKNGLVYLHPSNSWVSEQISGHVDVVYRHKWGSYYRYKNYYGGSPYKGFKTEIYH